MSTNPTIEKLLERYSPERRDMLRKILLGTTIYAAPMIASYSMQNLGGIANAQSQNQTIGTAIPVDSGLGLAAATGAIAAAGAFVLRRRRRKDDDSTKS